MKQRLLRQKLFLPFLLVLSGYNAFAAQNQDKDYVYNKKLVQTVYNDALANASVGGTTVKLTEQAKDKLENAQKLTILTETLRKNGTLLIYKGGLTALVGDQGNNNNGQNIPAALKTLTEQTNVKDASNDPLCFALMTQDDQATVIDSYTKMLDAHIALIDVNTGNDDTKKNMKALKDAFAFLKTQIVANNRNIFGTDTFFKEFEEIGNNNNNNNNNNSEPYMVQFLKGCTTDNSVPSDQKDNIKTYDTFGFPAADGDYNAFKDHLVNLKKLWALYQNSNDNNKRWRDFLNGFILHLKTLQQVKSMENLTQDAQNVLDPCLKTKHTEALKAVRLEQGLQGNLKKHYDQLEYKDKINIQVRQQLAELEAGNFDLKQLFELTFRGMILTDEKDILYQLDTSKGAVLAKQVSRIKALISQKINANQGAVQLKWYGSESLARLLPPLPAWLDKKLLDLCGIDHTFSKTKMKRFYACYEKQIEKLEKYAVEKIQYDERCHLGIEARRDIGYTFPGEAFAKDMKDNATFQKSKPDIYTPHYNFDTLNKREGMGLTVFRSLAWIVLCLWIGKRFYSRWSEASEKKGKKRRKYDDDDDDDDDDDSDDDDDDDDE